MAKYKLNFTWNGYEKGHVFETVLGNSIYIDTYGSEYIHKKGVDLLVKCGALAEIKECEDCEESKKNGYETCGAYGYSPCRKGIPSEVKKIEPFLRADTENQTFDKLNLLVTAINHLLNTKLK